MNNAVFTKTKENVKKHRYIKLVTTERRRNCLVSEPIIIHKASHREVISNRNKKKTQILRNKPIYLGLSIKKRF